ncbi:PLDc N-terminal domain-containing protein [Amycolatopsis circi]|uniref:PLDc N-terminal domain-containing protein n=1 Tax=Amycolatopsis circi TaxID=871959 RepID=UPI000E283A47|nr:PLDc N-terminal domain-containing protein [Amycolatopsis circi]
MTAVLADTVHRGLQFAAVAGMVALVAFPILLFIGALVSVLGSPLGLGMKFVWVIFAFCAPFLGPMLWFLVGKKSAEASFR